MPDAAPGEPDAAIDAALPSCPVSPTFPEGHYYVDLFVGSFSVSNYPPSSTPFETCRFARGPCTLDIGYDASSDSYQVDLRPLVSNSIPIYMGHVTSVHLDRQNGTTRFATAGVASPRIDFSIDDQTNIVTRLAYVESANFRGSYTSTANGVGWPVCDSTTSARPPALSPPTQPDACMGHVVPPECSWRHQTLPSPPLCPTTLDPGCACTVVADGYELLCCPT